MSLARFEDLLEAPSLGEERSLFFIALSRGNEKGSPPQAGSLLFIATGSVDMNTDTSSSCSSLCGLCLPSEIDAVSA